MKMKNYKTPALFTLMIIGLLVITGCSGLFEPPTKLSKDGSGTLLLSVNGAGGRTILPAAQLDKYVLTVTDGDTVVLEKELTGNTALSLAAGTYTLTVKGYIGDALVASAAEEVTLAAGEVKSVNIILEPAEDGEGTFSWDFSADEEATLTIAIFDIEDENEETDLGEITDLDGSITLAVGIYNVSFTKVVGEKTTSWREILYIYPGLDSSYSSADFIARQVQPSGYVAPESEAGFFYLNLNNWKTAGTSEGQLNPNVPAGEISADGLTVTFTEKAQRLHIKLSSEQAALMMAREGSITVTINGSASRDDTTFRFHLTDPTAGGGWNGTAAFADGTFSSILGVPKTAGFDATNKKEATVGYLTLQFERNTDYPFPTTVTINSIKIDYSDYQAPAAGPGFFYLNLNDWQTAGTSEGQLNPNVPEGGVTADGLTATFTENGQRLHIKLNSTQQAFMRVADSITVTINGESDPDSNFRFHLTDPTAGGSWNATATAHEGAFSSLNGVPKTTGFGPNKSPATVGYLTLQHRSDGETEVTIESIKIEYPFYETPAPGADYFYLDLNDWKTAGTSEGQLNPNVPEGAVSSGGLTATFTENGQRLHIKLSAAQQALMTAADSITVTINGESDPDSNFRFHLTDPTAGGSWNATATAHEGAFSSLNGVPKTTGFGPNKSPATVGYLTLQHRSDGETEVTIESIKIEYPFYETPAAGADYFYLDLNDWKTAGTSEGQLNPNVPEGTVSSGGLTATFTENGQRLHIKLSAAQQALMTAADSITVTINGESDPDSRFRFHLTDPTAGGSWNATADAHEGAFSSLNGVPKTTGFGANKSPATVGYLTLQHRSDGETEVTISSIKIEIPYYQTPAAGDDYFYLDLNDWKTAGTSEGQLNPNVPEGAVSSDALTATFTENGQRLHIKLSPAQSVLMMRVASIKVTINGEADPDSRFRFHLTDPTAGGSWNATADAHEGAFSSLNGEEKTTGFGGNKSLATVGYFTLQHRSDGETEVTINSIKIDYAEPEVTEPLNPPAVPATEDYTVVLSTLTGGPLKNATAWSGAYQTLGPWQITFPDGLDVRSYTKFTVKATCTSADGTAITDVGSSYGTGYGLGQVVFLYVSTGWETIATAYNLNVDAQTVGANIPQAVLDAEVARGLRIAIQNSHASIAFIEVTEITFHK